ncbi:MAG: hypothetical protein KDE45_13160 [Caldilineaceae bacterium]|nr:hypothetical protein [Caldilineaceae bacterium]
MTAQSPERLILDGRPRALYAEPLYRLCKQYRLDLRNPSVWCTANYRGYVGTWEIRGGALYLVHLCWDGCGGRNSEAPMSDDLLRQLLRAAGGGAFPLHAHWFNGLIRVAIGKRLVYSHHGWSHWHERERVMTFKGGVLVRDREVDTKAMLNWWLKRYPEMRQRLEPDDEPAGAMSLAPLAWFETGEEDALDPDWWPRDFPRPATALPV